MSSLNLESGTFELKSDFFRQSEQEVHVVDRLSRRTFDEVVDDRSDQQASAFFLQMDDAFVGVHHIFQVGCLVGHEGETVVVITLLVALPDFLYGGVDFGVNHRHDSS